MARTFAVYETLDREKTLSPVTTGSLVEVITRLLDECDTMELDLIQRLYLPKARFAAVSDQRRTTPIETPGERRT